MFKTYLSAFSQEKLRLENERLFSLFHLPDFQLGLELLNLARDVQAGLKSAGYSHVERIVYDPVMAWDLIPEVAYRLGVRDFNPDERQHDLVRGLSTAALRERVGLSLMNCGSIAMRNSLLNREPANGNPLVFAIDRLATPGAQDVVAARLKEVASLRRVAFDGAWTIDFLGERGSASMPERQRG